MLGTRNTSKPIHYANEIIPRLWIGDSYSSEDPNFFKAYKISVVVNCTSDLKCSFKNVEYFRVSVQDSLKQKDFNIMTQTLPEAVEFIHKKRDLEKKSVLVHCLAGMQRSCAVVTAYLCKYHKMTMEEAVTHVLKYRSVAFHHGRHINFIDALRTYYISLRKNKRSSSGSTRSSSRTIKSPAASSPQNGAGTKIIAKRSNGKR